MQHPCVLWIDEETKSLKRWSSVWSDSPLRQERKQRTMHRSVKCILDCWEIKMSCIYLFIYNKCLKIGTKPQEVCIWFRKFCTDLWSQGYHKKHHLLVSLDLVVNGFKHCTGARQTPHWQFGESSAFKFSPRKMVWIETWYINESWTLPCKSPKRR